MPFFFPSFIFFLTVAERWRSLGTYSRDLNMHGVERFTLKYRVRILNLMRSSLIIGQVYMLQYMFVLYLLLGIRTFVRKDCRGIPY